MKKWVIEGVVAKPPSPASKMQASLKAPSPKAPVAVALAAKMSHIRMGINGFGRTGRFVFISTYMGNSRKCGPIIQLVF